MCIHKKHFPVQNGKTATADNVKQRKLDFGKVQENNVHIFI